MAGGGMVKSGEVTNKPWEKAQPFLESFLPEIQGLYDSQKGTNTYANRIPGQSGMVPGRMRTDSRMFGLYNQAGQPGAADQYLTGTARGDYLTNNPYIDQVASAATDPVVNQLKAQYAAMGRGMSGKMAQDIVTSAGNVRAGLLNQNYQSERDRMMQAAGGLESAQQGRLGMQRGILGDINQSDMSLLGARMQANNQDYLRQENTYDRGQDAIWGPAQRYAQLLNGVTGQYGTQTQYEPGANNLLRVIGGIGTLLGGFGSFLSDERAKTDIRKVGKTDKGLPIYSYHYRGMEDGPTFMGVLAQEAQRRQPKAVTQRPDGLLAVDYSRVR